MLGTQRDRSGACGFRVVEKQDGGKQLGIMLAEKSRTSVPSGSSQKGEGSSSSAIGPPKEVCSPTTVITSSLSNHREGDKSPTDARVVCLDEELRFRGLSLKQPHDASSGTEGVLLGIGESTATQGQPPMPKKPKHLSRQDASCDNTQERKYGVTGTNMKSRKRKYSFEDQETYPLEERFQEIVRLSPNGPLLCTKKVASENESMVSRFGGMRKYLRFVQRSGAKDVRRLLCTIEKQASLQMANVTSCTQSSDTTFAPYSECDMITCWATDEYYRVIIARTGGIAIFLKATAAFEEHTGIVESCLCTLGKICARNENNQRQFQKSGGINITCRAMRTHAESSSVLSSGCVALWEITPVLISSMDRKSNWAEILETLQIATSRRITNEARECAEMLIQSLEAQK